MSSPSFQSLRDLPEEVQLFLLDTESFEQVRYIIADYNLPPEAVDQLLDLAEGVVLQKHDLAELPRLVAETFFAKPETAKEIAVDLAGYRLLPIADLVGNVAGYMAAWGGEVGDFDAIPRVSIKSLDPVPFIEELLASVEFRLEDDHFTSRLISTLVDSVTHQKDLEATREILMKDLKVGGLELSEEIANGLLSVVQDAVAKRSLPFAGSRANEPVRLIPLPPPAPRKPSPPKSVSESIPSLSPEEEDHRDIAPFAERVKKMLCDIPALRDPKTATGCLVDLLKGKDGMKVHFSDSRFGPQFASIVESRLRDIRTVQETKLQLEKALESGGGGLSGRLLVDAIELIEATVRDMETVEANRMREEKNAGQEKRNVAKQTEQALVKKETQLLAKRYVEITGKVPSELIAPAAPALVRGTVAKSPQETLADTERKIDTDKVREVIEAAKVPARPAPARFSPQSIPPPAPHMQDIRPVRTISGPVEELSAMTLIDFRRLSRRPEEAVMKIKDRIELLTEESYQKRMDGIKAWRSSPLNRLYLTLSERSLMTGTPIVNLLRTEGEKSSGKDVMPTLEEIQAIRTLNGSLRF